MRRQILLVTVVTLLVSDATQAQLGTPGEQYSHVIAAGEGGQLYPYDQQDPWLHGQYQRIPAYGGFASFRPYNYRHVFAQTQIATGWGMPHGLPYSQQFWNRYRGSYLNGDLHSAQAMYAPQATVASPSSRQVGSWQQAVPSQQMIQVQQAGQFPVGGSGQHSALQLSAPANSAEPRSAVVSGHESDRRPIHVFPASVRSR